MLFGNFHPDLLSQIARTHGTPCYVYAGEKIDAQCTALLKAFSSHPTTFCYAVKANTTRALLEKIFRKGIGADVVSGGELQRALNAGARADQIVFSGVGKQDWEIELGIDRGILAFNAESLSELERISAIATGKKKSAGVFLRVNPNIDAKTNPYIATGLYSTKFGIAESLLDEAVHLGLSLPGLKLRGLGCHLGSQIKDAKVFKQAARRLSRLTESLKTHPDFQYLDLGGGLAVRYSNEKPPSVDAYAKAVLSPLQKNGLKLVLEPGRWLIAESGALLTRVIATKKTPKKRFVIVDAAMNDLIRPSLYEAYHPIVPVEPRKGPAQTVDIVGPICETGDFLALNRKLPPLKEGDLVLVGVTGAYSAAMASQYNSRPRAPEVLIEAGRPKVIRRRETLESLTAFEV